MTYQALARKWRPQDFSSIVGQEAVVTALRNSIAEDRIAQAYLFSGIRGVGKTTAARVLAKALNCETRRDAAESTELFSDPCNNCVPCREITRGSDLDVIEIDAATYSKVEQVRELTESLRYGPARDTYKVVVIDEIHRLSRQAFDALLKIVEEPPSHLVFIFATTEIEVVPATLLSRCQDFHFRRVSAADLVSLLKKLTDAENIDATERALRLIARAGEGSARDAVALLDQLATFGSGKIAEEDAVRLLGGLDLRLFHHLLSSILSGDSSSVSTALQQVEDQGWDPRRTHTQFLAYCRDALHAAVGTEANALDLPKEDADQLVTLARETGYENLLRLLNQLLKSEELVRRSDAPALAVEIAWLRAAELPKLTRIEEILSGAPAPKRREALEEPAPAKAPRPRASDADPTPSSAQPATPTTAQPEPTADGPRLSRNPKEALLELVSQRKQPLAARLRQCQSLEVVGSELRIVIAQGDDWPREALERSQNKELLDQAVAELWGKDASWTLVEGGPVAEPVESASTAVGPAVEHPVVQSALDLFAGTIETIEETQPNTEDQE